MKRTWKLLTAIFVSAVLSVGNFESSAQNFDFAVGTEPEMSSDSLSMEIFVPEGYKLVDSLVYRYTAVCDTALVGKDILQIMPMRISGGNANVEVNQSQRVTDALRMQVEANGKRTITGYRVRIFFDNKQSARVESANTLKNFQEKYRDIKAYRTYVNPYFKVTVGDCRTRSEAMALLNRIKGQFPSAFVVKESIDYPVVDAGNAFYIDTLKVLKPISVEL